MGDPPAVVDLAPVFDGTVDSYRAIAADPRLVTVMVNGSRLSLSGLAAGSTTVTVTAMSANGTALQEFGVTVRTRLAQGE